MTGWLIVIATLAGGFFSMYMAFLAWKTAQSGVWLFIAFAALLFTISASFFLKPRAEQKIQFAPHIWMVGIIVTFGLCILAKIFFVFFH